jgi:hypothetical protein
MATPLDLRDAVQWMTTRWPSAQRDWSEWESLAAEFAGYTAGALKEALHAWYRRGESRAPNPSQLVRLVGEIQALRVSRGVDDFQAEWCTDGEHLWALPLPTDEDRHASCVRCGEPGPEHICDHPAVQVHADGRRICPYCLKAVA